MLSRIEIVRWVAENKRPFAIVKDRGFIDLMKTAHPMYRIPSPATVARDVKHVFVSMRPIIAAKLKVLTFTVHVAHAANHEGTRWLPQLCN